MVRRPLLATLVAAVALMLPPPVSGQAEDAPPPRATLSLTIGSLGLSNLQEQPVLAERIGGDDSAEGEGEVPQMAVLTRTLRATDGRTVNAVATISLGRTWAAWLGGGVGGVRLAQAYEGGEDWLPEAAAIPVSADPEVRIVSLGGGLRFMVPTSHGLRPYLELGASAERWSSDASLPRGAGDVDTATRFAALVAVGGTYRVRGGLSATARVSTRVLGTPLPPVAAGTELGRTETLVLTAQAPAGARFADTAVSAVRSTRWELGLSFALGVREPAPPDRPESDESPPAPDR
jgi:hypothetical protein